MRLITVQERYERGQTFRLVHGDCLEVMAGMEAGSVDAVVTDPPYGLAFMGKHWDHGIPGVDFWTEALDVMKPSAYLLAFGGTRTWHRLACAIEDAGFEIRDTLMWLYGSGFPKGKACLKPAWEPIILARKPGPMRELGIEECRIPIEGCIDPVRRSYNQPGKGLGHGEVYGVWGGQYDGARTPHPDSPRHHAEGRWPANLILDEEAGALLDSTVGTLKSGKAPATGFIRNSDKTRNAYGDFKGNRDEPTVLIGDSGGPSRFFFNVKGDPCDVNTAGPSSCPLSGLDASALSDALTLAARAASEQATADREVTAACTSSCSGCTRTPNPALCAAILANIGTIPTTTSPSKSCGSVARATDAPTNSASAARVAVDSAPESVTRFLYSPKASRAERNRGLEGMEARRRDLSRHADQPSMNGGDGNPYNRGAKRVQNHHPTVKPLALMRWLVRLVAHEGDLVLDPFTGSGTTGVACVEEGRDFIGIERESEYVTIARRRIEAAEAQLMLPVET